VKKAAMHRGIERDYRYLLSRIVPRHLLSIERRAELEGILAGGNRFDLVREAYVSMEELARTGAFLGGRVSAADGTVSISYRSALQAMTITLAMTADEWEGVTGAKRRAEGILPSVFAGIISSLALNDSSKTVIMRIDELLSLAGRISDGAQGKLLFVKSIPAIREFSREKVAFLPLNEALKRKLYHACLTSGMPHTFIRIAGGSATESVYAIDGAAKSILMIPLQARDVKWAILEIHLPDESPPDRNAASNFHILADGLVRLIENNAHLEKMVSIDRLTEVHNRNYYEMQVPLEIERANRNKMTLAFLIIDIDDFKKVNDVYGHAVGDHVLRLVAQTVRKSLRKIDLLFRYGGEEFIVLLPGTGAESAQRTAERIRGIVARAEHPLDDGRKVKVTISIGGCLYPQDAQNESHLLRMADKALYLAKEKGKNRVVFCGE
jgi:diguanylate cyclase (GGDEF)-like protein